MLQGNKAANKETARDRNVSANSVRNKAVAADSRAVNKVVANKADDKT